MSADVWKEINARPSKLRPWGSGLKGERDRSGQIPPLPRIGPTRKLDRRPCPSCGERNFYCTCGEAA